MGLGGIEFQGNVRSFIVNPVESSIQNVQTEIAIDNQIVVRWLVGLDSTKGGGLLPDHASLLRLALSDQITDVIIDIAELCGLAEVYDLRPHLCRGCSFILCHQKFQE